MDESGRTVGLDGIGIAEPHHWTPSDDGLSLDESSCSTVVTDSADSDSTPSPFLLGGLQFLKRTEMHDVGICRQCESEDTYCTKSDDSQSTNCSESILDPTKRLKGISIIETEAAHTNNQRFTNYAENKSPVISVVSHPSSDHQHQSPFLKIHQPDGRDCQIIEENSLMAIDNLQETAKNLLASRNHGALSPDLSLGHGTDSSPIRRHIHVSRQIDDSSCGKNSGADGDRMDDISSQPCSSDIAAGPVGGPDSIIVSKTQECGTDSLDHRSAPTPEKMMKLSDGSERGCYLSDSLEDVTQVDGSACMFSDSSAVKSPSDSLLLPRVHSRDAGNSEDEVSRTEQQVEHKADSGNRQMSCRADHTTFDECQNTNFSCIETCSSSRQIQPGESAIIQPSTTANASGSSTTHPEHEAGTEYDLTCNESINSVEIERKVMKITEGAKDAAETKPKPDRISHFSRVEANERQENNHTDSRHSDENAESSVGEGLQSSKRDTDSTDMAKVAGGQGKAGNKFAKKGKRQKRSLQAVNERATSSHFDRSCDELTTRSQRQNAGIHRSDTLIHGRVLGLQEKLTNVMSCQNKLTQSLSKPKNVIKDAAKVGQQLLGIQTNLRQIAADLKEAKTDLERSLFDLRFVHSQRKRKGYVQQELNSVLEIQQTLWTQLKVHREIASRLQEIIRKHTNEMKETRRKQAKHSTEKRKDRRQSARLTLSSDGSAGSSCDNGTDAASGCTTKESIAAEKQNALLQQLLGTLGECEGNLLVKFMSVLQGRGQDQDKALPAKSSLGDLGEEKGGGMMKSVNLASSSGDRDNPADVGRLRERGEADAREILRDSPDLSAESSPRPMKDRAGSRSKSTPGLHVDIHEKEMAPDDDCSSSGDGCAGEFLSSSDDEMSVVPEPSHKLPKAPNCKVPETKSAVCILGQVSPTGQVVPEVVQVGEDASGSGIALHGEILQPYDTTGKSLPTVKTHFNLDTIPKPALSVNAQIVHGAHPQTLLPVVARLSSQIGHTRLSPVKRVSLKAVPLLQDMAGSTSDIPKSSLQDEQHRSKLSNRVDIGTTDRSPALGLQCGEKVRIQQDGAISRGSPHISANESTYEERTRPVDTNADHSLGAPSAQRDAPRYRPDQIPGIPDMKLYKKIHLINEKELIPYTEILPKQMWTTDDISMVEMPQEFFDEIDSW